MIEGMKIHWVATYGPMGLEVEHFLSEKQAKKAERKAEREHDNGQIDSWSAGSNGIKMQIRSW